MAFGCAEVGESAQCIALLVRSNCRLAETITGSAAGWNGVAGILVDVIYCRSSIIVVLLDLRTTIWVALVELAGRIGLDVLPTVAEAQVVAACGIQDATAAIYGVDGWAVIGFYHLSLRQLDLAGGWDGIDRGRTKYIKL